MESRLACALMILEATTLALPASAERPGPGEELAAQGADQGRPIAPLAPRAARYHDGFYLRLSLGLGAMDARSTADGTTASSNVLGAGPALDVLAGGTPLPGLVVGGGLVTQMAARPTVSYSGDRLGLADGAGTQVTTWVAGPMIDIFPDPSGGFHAGGVLGLADLGLEDPAGNRSRGVGISAWAGYGFWSGPQWSLGGLLRLTALGTERSIHSGPNQYGVSDGTVAVSAMFSACYH